MLKGHTIVVGVTGGIAAYKSAEIVRKLKKLSADVHVIMTENACQFITPLTMQTLSQNLVAADMFEKQTNWEIEHISLAQKADMIIVAPATANIIGKIANGIADDMLSTTIMASKAPVMFACAMNTNMYENQIVQSNISKLKKVGYLFNEPEEGFLACNEEGKGRLADVDDIIEKAVRTLLYKPDLAGKTVLVTAGPTREKLDPIRYITNGSTGSMGYAAAKTACARGAKVILISGPTALKKLIGVETVYVETAQQMHDEVIKRHEHADIVIMAAAVADYKPKTTADNKIKKSADELSIELIRNPDILKEVGAKKGKSIVVGFSMETENIEANSIKKLKDKNLDLIIANEIGQEGAGFGTDTNIVKLINKFGMVCDLPIMSKQKVADKIIDEILNIEKIQKEIK
ncbi:MAG: bifunctional phosphopantothenoylcysteine decarboxylase/phosphopantothenate--cysteine ligase CoaBC [Deltaproteobacteria bacterium]